MTLFDRIFKNKKDKDPFYIKLKKSLLEKDFTVVVQKAYFLFGLPNTVENASALKKSIFNSCDLKTLKDTAQYDVGVDNLELYFIEEVPNKYYFIILLDPYELYEREEVLEIIAVNEYKLDFELRLIYSAG